MAQRAQRGLTLSTIALMGVVGLAAGAAAQPQDQKQGEDQGGLRGDEQRPLSEQTQPEREEGEPEVRPNPRLQEAWRRFQQAGEGEPPAEAEEPQRGRVPTRIESGRPAVELIPEEGGGDGGEEFADEPVTPDTIFRLPAFAEPVQLQSLVDWISRRLQVNIFTDPSLGDRSVVFNGPLEVRADELLDLLSLLLEQQGFVLVQSREGWYSIRPSAEAPVSFGDGELATTRVIPTPLLRPSSLKPAIDTALGTGGAGGSARIAYIDELAVIIMTDRPSSLRAVQRIVQEVVDVQTSMELRRFPLIHLSAAVARDKVVELNNLGASGSGQRAAQPQAAGQPAVAAAGASGGLSNLGDRLYIDSGSNSLLFRGSSAEASRLERLVELVDVPSALYGKRYEAGPASQMIVEFGQSQGLGPVTQVSTGQGSFGTRGGFTGGVGAQRPGAQQSESVAGSRFALEDSQQAFVYFGTQAQHAQVESLVESFADQARGARVVVEFYKLRHANAESVAEVLNGLIEDQSQQFGQSPFLPSPVGFQNNQPIRRAIAQGGEGSAEGEGEGESLGLTYTEDIRIQADVDRNQIVIKAPQRQQREFARIIEKIDIRRPQVYIEAKIIAVSASEDFRLAVDTLATPGQQILLTNFGLAFPTLEGGGATGFQGAIIPSGDVEFVINALTSNTTARIISSPRILVNDNEEGSVNSLRQEPYAETTQNASTTTTSQGGVAEAGTTLTVTPRISDSGMLNLEYEIELSSFDERTQEQIEAGLQPPKQTETYSGSVALPNDATIVVGGLTNQRDGETVDKVPLLGDLPIIGEVFRATRKNTSASTIYVFIRPRILSEPNFNDLRLLTKGPQQESRLEGDTPALEPVRMPTLGLTLEAWKADLVRPRVGTER